MNQKYGDKVSIVTECEHFSFHVTRGQGHCSLQSTCQVTTPCREEEYCVAGLKTCA